jgi:hypothetical protein
MRDITPNGVFGRHRRKIMPFELGQSANKHAQDIAVLIDRSRKKAAGLNQHILGTPH